MKYLMLSGKCSNCKQLASIRVIDLSVELRCPICNGFIANAEYRDIVGYVYVLYSPAMPCLFKVGYTENHPDERANDISRSTGVPEPFRVFGYARSEFAKNDEALIHEQLAHYRVAENREFFSAEILMIVRCIESITKKPFEKKCYDGIPINIIKNSDIWRPRIVKEIVKIISPIKEKIVPRKAQCRKGSYFCIECGKPMRKISKNALKSKGYYAQCTRCSFIVDIKGYECIK